MQLTLELGTVPLEVDGLKVQLTVSTVVPTGCSTLITALVNDTSVIVSVQFFEFGQPGAPGIGFVGGLVVTLKATLPFLTWDAGMAWDPVKVTGAGLCPGRAVARSRTSHPASDGMALSQPIALALLSEALA